MALVCDVPETLTGRRPGGLAGIALRHPFANLADLRSSLLWRQAPQGSRLVDRADIFAHVT